MRNTVPRFLGLPLAVLLVGGASPHPNRTADEVDEDQKNTEESAQEAEGEKPEENGQEADKVLENGQEAEKSAPGQVHTVTKGDTLWDLSQQYLGSSWYWPKVWSYNPEIANPHWIYPGNKVRFYPAGPEGPARVEVVGQDQATDEGGSAEAASDEDTTGIQVAGKIGYHPSRSVRLARQGFVTQREVEAAGIISGSPAESEMLSFPDTVYLTFRNTESVKVGGQYTVFHTAAEVLHPVSRKRYGFITHVIGTVRVTRLAKNYVVAEINTGQWDEIRRGDLIGPSDERLITSVANHKNEREIHGLVIGTLIPFLTLYGENHVVVVDRGSADGVQVGNTFTVGRQQDPVADVQAFLNPAKAQDPRLPEETVATCMVVEVKEPASLCLITRSLREIVYGDRVTMSVQDSNPPTASLPPTPLLNRAWNQ